MPIYICNAVSGVIPQRAKAKVAVDITDIHCEMTGTPRSAVHVFFFEDAPQLPINSKSVFLFGSIRGGGADRQKSELMERMKASIFTHTGIPFSQIIADAVEVPASWVLEGDDFLHKPGEEKEWSAAHSSTTAQTIEPVQSNDQIYGDQNVSNPAKRSCRNS